MATVFLDKLTFRACIRIYHGTPTSQYSQPLLPSGPLGFGKRFGSALQQQTGTSVEVLNQQIKGNMNKSCLLALTVLSAAGRGKDTASFPVPRPAFQCKRRKAGRGTGNEASKDKHKKCRQTTFSLIIRFMVMVSPTPY